MARWKDKNGKTLRDFPQPTMAIDVALLTVPEPLAEDSRVHVLLHRRTDGSASGQWALPGTLVRKKERLSAAVARTLRIKTGITGVTPVQLEVFDDPDRDARGWVMTVAHAGLMPYGPLLAAVGQSPDVTLAPLDEGLALLPDRQARLPFDNARVVQLAAQWAADAYAAGVDPYGLLTPPFTLTQLRRLHQAIEGRSWQKDVFRRRVEGALEPVGGRAVLTTGRPAALLQLRAG